jgi:hypothetical protein
MKDPIFGIFGFVLAAVMAIGISGCDAQKTQTNGNATPVPSATPAATEMSREALVERLGKKGVVIKTKAAFRVNPLLLSVSVSQGGAAPKYNLNLENDLTGGDLTRKLREVFDSREKSGTLRPGSNEVEKTVSIAAGPRKLADYKTRSIRVEDIEALVEVLKSAGARPIVLDLNPTEIEEAGIDEEPPPPPASNRSKP